MAIKKTVVKKTTCPKKVKAATKKVAKKTAPEKKKIVIGA
jgi:hypothetical protein